MTDLGFGRIAIVNRSEPAMRLINTVQDFNLEHGTDVRTIALFTHTDRNAMFVREADESYCIGPAVYTDERGTRRVGYLDHQRLEDALIATGADAAWPGWGFVAEQAEFADLCDSLGVVFIGPDGATLRSFGDKITSKQIAEQLGLPVVPWSGGPVETVGDALAVATRISYPLIIKATAGGGGRGIRRVADPEELAALFPSARSEAASAFGNDTVFLERVVPGARHIEVQIIGDNHGTVWPVGVRDCTVQRRNQKIIEEAPSPALSAEQHRKMLEAAAELGRAAGYRNAGTVEFLFELGSGDFWFTEVNARLQVEHPITELTTGLDLVKLQLLMASGSALEGPGPQTVGHAVEIRLNAEDPAAGFAPAPGRLDLLRFPVGPGIRVDTGVEMGDSIAPEYDSMIAKIIAYGTTRAEAVSRLRRALRQTAVVVRDGMTNKSFVEFLLASPEFAAGTLDVGWVDGLSGLSVGAGSALADIAIVAAAIAGYEEEVAIDRRSFRVSANRGRPQVDPGIGRTVGLRYRGTPYDVHTAKLSPERYRLTVDGVTTDATIENTGLSRQRIHAGGRSYRLLSAVQGASYFIEVDGAPHRITHDEGGVIRAPSPAVVVSITVEPGDTVEKGGRLAVIEAMKMETQITAQFAGRVREVLVRENTQVATGAPLMILEPTIGEATGASGGRVDFTGLESATAGDHVLCQHRLAEIRQMMLGYDVDPGAVTRLTRSVGRRCADGIDEEEIRRVEDEILELFVNIISLFWRDPIDEEYAEITRRSSEAHLFSYLKDTSSTGALPGRFMGRLRRALAHYGVSDEDPSDLLEGPLYRIAKSHQRMGSQAQSILTILDNRVASPGHFEDLAFRTVLERIIPQTRIRFPAIHDLAREVFYATFDAPFLARVKREAYQEAERRVGLLITAPGDAGRLDHVLGLVECPQSLTSFLSRRFQPGAREANSALLEVMVRRFYRIRPLDTVATSVVGRHSAVTAEYDYEGRRVRVVAVHARYDRIGSGLEAVGSIAAANADLDHDVVAELFVWREGEQASADATRDEILELVNTFLGGAQLRRIVVSVSSPARGMGIDGVLHFTFRPDGHGYREETLYRDLHPMVGKRLQLWRLDAFNIERLPTLEDIYLFHATARSNPRDERFFALAEVRDVTPILDEQGHVVRLPDFERMFHEVLGSIRRFQARRPDRRRLSGNRVMLHAWPVLELTRAEIRGLVDRLAPDAEDIGLEKVEVMVRVSTPGSRKVLPVTLAFENRSGRSLRVRIRRTRSEPIEPLTEFEQQVAQQRQRGLAHPLDIVGLLTGGGDERTPLPVGEFQEYDLVDGSLQSTDRPTGRNTANVVVGTITNFTETYREGMRRVVIIGDPSRGMGSLAGPECTRIIAALDLAEETGMPVEWFAVSAGALISMESGTENMDWIGRVLRRLVEFTQAGGEVNVIVTGVNAGAQPYWNAEATMLMHTKGILIMTPESAMVLTGKQALDFSGGVSAEDNQGIGGYERIMGPNGQGQYFARHLADAGRILIHHYEHTYVVPGERFPRRAATSDPIERNIEASPHGGEFEVVGDVFSEIKNPGRKKPFEVRQVMAAVVDHDHATLERWYGMQHAEVAVVWDAHIGGFPVSLIGFESRPMARAGFVPADGPDQWMSGTLYPVASKKVARAINAASGNRPLVVLANLSGFDGSPESMRNLQLEYGAEIGRAVVNFEGPIVFCVISRYHGGAFVVFSNTLNDNMEIAALQGAQASVIGGAPAAAVVFAREVRRRTDEDPRVVGLVRSVGEAAGPEKGLLRAQLNATHDEVYSEKLGEVADEFDAVHHVERARQVGSVHTIIEPARLRAYLVEAINRGMQRELERWGHGR